LGCNPTRVRAEGEKNLSQLKFPPYWDKRDQSPISVSLHRFTLPPSSLPWVMHLLSHCSLLKESTQPGNLFPWKAFFSSVSIQEVPPRAQSCSAAGRISTL